MWVCSSLSLSFSVSYVFRLKCGCDFGISAHTKRTQNSSLILARTCQTNYTYVWPSDKPEQTRENGNIRGKDPLCVQRNWTNLERGNGGYGIMYTQFTHTLTHLANDNTIQHKWLQIWAAIQLHQYTFALIRCVNDDDQNCTCVFRANNIFSEPD